MKGDYHKVSLQSLQGDGFFFWRSIVLDGNSINFVVLKILYKGHFDPEKVHLRQNNFFFNGTIYSDIQKTRPGTTPRTDQ